MQDFESNSVALYNQQIIQILCSDTLELEIELARDLVTFRFFCLSKSEIDFPSRSSVKHRSQWRQRRQTIRFLVTTRHFIRFGFVAKRKAIFYRIHLKILTCARFQASNWHDVTIEYLRFNGSKKLRQVSFDEIDSSKLGFNETRRWSSRENDRVLDEIAQRQQNLRKTRISTERKDENPGCLHDRLMFEIKQQRVLRPIQNQSIKMTTSFDSPRKRIRPIQVRRD